MDNNVLDQIEQYRNDVSCDYNWYIIGRLIIIALCLGCAGYLTCYLSEHCRQCEISWESKVMMILFIVLALILAGFVIFRMTFHKKRVQTALARLDALILQARIYSIENKAKVDAVKQIIGNEVNKVTEATNKLNEAQAALKKADSEVLNTSNAVKEAEMDLKEANISADDTAKIFEEAKKSSDEADANAEIEARKKALEALREAEKKAKEAEVKRESAKKALEEANNKKKAAEEDQKKAPGALEEAKKNEQKVSEDSGIVQKALKEELSLIEKGRNVINVDRELQLIVRILES